MSERPERTSRRRARRLLIVLLLLGGITALLLALAYGPSLAARNAMLDGRDAIGRGQQLLLDGNEREARAQFLLARDAFEDATRSASHPALRVLSVIPFLGRTPEAAHGIAEIGAHIAEAGFAVSDGLSDLPEGIGSLSPRKGRVPLDVIEQLQEPMHRANAEIQEAARIARDIPETWVLAPVADAGRLLRDRLGRVAPLSQTADSLFSVLPSFAGADGPRRYFVAGQNPAEARGTGGFIGVYSLLTMDDGKIRLDRFRDIGEFPTPRRVPPAPEDLAAVYGGDITSSLKATNLVPDVPTAAGLIDGIWRSSGRGELDGVIFVDPLALERLLRVTGPVPSREAGTTLDARNAVDFLTNDAYFRFDTTARERKDALGAATEEVWDRFVAKAPPRGAVEALSDAASDGHIVVWARDPATQAAFAQAGVAGEFRDTGTDFFGSVINNAAGNKVDFYLRRELSYEVTLRPDGSANASAAVSLTNTAPKGAQPSYALGPTDIPPEGYRLRAGDNLSIAGTYCASGCVALGTSLNGGKPLLVTEHEENGLTMLSTGVLLRPKETKVLGFELQNPDAWTATTVGGTYRLRIQANQAVDPVTGEVRIHLPEGMEPTLLSPDVREEAGVLVWNGEIGAGADISVSFQQPLPQRALTRLEEFLRRPVIDL